MRDLTANAGCQAVYKTRNEGKSGPKGNSVSNTTSQRSLNEKKKGGDAEGEKWKRMEGEKEERMRKKCGRAKKEAFLFQGHGVAGTLQQYILRLVRLLFIVTLVTLNPSILASIRFALVDLLLCDERSGRLHLKRDSRERDSLPPYGRSGPWSQRSAPRRALWRLLAASRPTFLEVVISEPSLFDGPPASSVG